MTTYRVGDIVSVNFPFADLQVQKRRPGLVLKAVMSTSSSPVSPRTLHDINPTSH